MSDKNNNSGNWNTGDRNSGDLNSGNLNSGDLNSGNWNTGNRNSGNLNSGNWNTGNRNSGNLNSGDMNTGHRNSGFFCTETPSPTFFDNPTTLTWEEAYECIPSWKPKTCVEWVESKDMTDKEKAENKSHETTGGFLRKYEVSLRDQFAAAWPSFDEETKKRWISLPNFDADKFYKIMGVDVRKKEKSEVDSRIENQTMGI